MGLFSLYVIDNQVTLFKDERAWLMVTQHDLIGITRSEMYQLMGFEEDGALLEEDHGICEVPYQAVATLAKRYGFEDESRLYSYYLLAQEEEESPCAPECKRQAINQQSPFLMANRRICKAERALRQGRTTLGFRLYAATLEAHPEEFNVCYLYAKALDKYSQTENRIEKAVRLLKRAFLLAPTLSEECDTLNQITHYYTRCGYRDSEAPDGLESFFLEKAARIIGRTQAEVLKGKGSAAYNPGLVSFSVQEALSVSRSA